MAEHTDTAIEQAVINLCLDLMRRPSVTPADAGCLEEIAKRLSAVGFNTRFLDAPEDAPTPGKETRNLWASRTFGTGAGPHLLFAGHTDVVPTGPMDQWSLPPFEPQIQDGYLCGRGAADMKSSLAAMVVATERTCGSDQLDGTLSFLLTSDEEGDATWGTQYALQQLAAEGIQPNFCIVGEPSSSTTVGDVVRCGRRGSINCRATFKGVQGHVAYPDDAVNPTHEALTALHNLTTHRWDAGNEYYPPTSLQISNLHAGTGATNVVPGELVVDFNLRFSTEQTATSIQDTVVQLLAEAGYREDNLTLEWRVSGHPFLTRRGRLTDAVVHAVSTHCGVEPELSTSGGTSDGRFIAPWSVEGPGPDSPHRVDVVELGPTNATIHKIDERIPTKELVPLTRTYASLIEQLVIAEAPSA